MRCSIQNFAPSRNLETTLEIVPLPNLPPIKSHTLQYFEMLAIEFC